MLDHTLKPGVTTGRLEVITETGDVAGFPGTTRPELWRRRWSRAQSFPPDDMG